MVVVFQHSHAIDGISREPLRDDTVIIANGKIVGIQKNLKRVAAGAKVIDANRKWLLPGYSDSHRHINDFESAQKGLAVGITTARTRAAVTSSTCYLFLVIKGGQFLVNSLPEKKSSDYDRRLKTGLL